MNIYSIQPLNKFGLLLILLLFTSTLFTTALCQSKKITIIINLNKFENLDQSRTEKIINLLNMETNLTAIIVMGEISKSGLMEDYRNVYSALEKLKTQYYVIGGYIDYSGIQNYSSNFNQVFDNDEFVLTDNNKILIGINSLIPNYPDNAFIKVESLTKVLEEIKSVNYNLAYLFTNNSLSTIQNIKYLLNLLKNKYIISFYPTEKTFSAQINSDYNILEIGIPPSTNSDELNYFILEEIDDTILVVKKNNKTDLPEIQYSASRNDQILLNVSVDQPNIDSSLTKIFEIEFNASSKSGNITTTNRIYTILDNGLIYLNDQSGKEKFVCDLMGTIKNNPILYKDLLLTATLEGDLYSINSNTGEVLQVVGIGENITSDIAIIETATLNSKSIGAVFGTSEGNIFCYDAFSFELLWKNNISNVPIISTPYVEKDKVIFLNSSSSLYCVNSKSGSLNWKYEFSEMQNFSPQNYPLCDGKNVFSLSPDGNLFAIDLLLGKKSWSSNTKSVLNQLYLTEDKQKLLLLDGKGRMTIFSVKDGKEISKIDFNKSRIFSYVIKENQENIFVGFSDGSLYSLDFKSIPKQLISTTQIPITSINVIDKNEFIVKDINGKITFYKIN